MAPYLFSYESRTQICFQFNQIFSHTTLFHNYNIKKKTVLQMCVSEERLCCVCVWMFCACVYENELKRRWQGKSFVILLVSHLLIWLDMISHWLALLLRIILTAGLDFHCVCVVRDWMRLWIEKGGRCERIRCWVTDQMIVLQLTC